MPDPTFERIEELFSNAAELTTTARGRYLEAECADQPELRARVERMLDADGGDDFITAAINETAREAAAEPPGTWIGRELGPYRITGEIGHGGMGTVYAAERVDGAYEATVAIKIIRGALAGGEAFRRFLAERQILGGLTHPNIARLLDAGRTPDGVPYMVMEHVDGVPIDRYCDERRLTIAERVALFRKVCEAVHHAHRGFVVHRDIKPGNILVTAAGEPKLLDFGIAKLLDTGDEWLNRTVTAAAVMTPAYASPEQLLGEAITAATDVHGLGLVLYELLTGAPAHEFTDRSPREVDRVVCRDMPPSPAARFRTGAEHDPDTRARLRLATPQKLRRLLAGDLGTIVETAMDKEPGRRYPTVNALLDDLHRFGDGLPITARPDTLVYRARRFVGRHPVAVATAVAVTIMLAGLASAAVMQGVRATRERDMAEIRRQVAAEVSAFLVDARRTPSGPSDLVAQGESRIAALGDRPAVRAGLMAAVGRLYHLEGLHDQAADRLDEALGLRLDLFGRDAGEVAASHQALGDLRLDAGRVDDALGHYREALRIRAALLEPGHRDRLETRVAVARATAEAGDADAAESMYGAALADIPDGDLTRADIFFEMADVLHRNGRPAAGRSAADSAYSIRQAAVPADHPALEASRVQAERFAVGDPGPFTTLAEQRLIAPLPTPFDVLHGDFDGDGRLDLVWNHRGADNLVRVAFGTGTGEFAMGEEVARVTTDSVADWSDWMVAVGDFDGDGRDDLVWNRLGALNHFVVGLGDGAGGFHLGQRVRYEPPLRPGFDPSYRIGFNDFARWGERGRDVADYTNDGIDDLFWYHDRLPMGWAAVSRGGGQLQPLDLAPSFPYGPDPEAGIDVGERIDAALFARGPGGRTRLVIARWEAYNEIRVAEWDAGLGLFTTPTIQRYDINPYYMYDLVGIWHYYRLTVGDVDGDGLDDLIWVDPATPYAPAASGNRVYVARGQDGERPFDLDRSAFQDSLTLGDAGPFEVHVADVNGDGRADLLWDRRTIHGENRMYVSYGTTEGRFDPRPGRFLHPAGGDWTRSRLLTGDVDGDGRDDVVWVRTGALNRVHVALGRNERSGGPDP